METATESEILAPSYCAVRGKVMRPGGRDVGQRHSIMDSSESPPSLEEKMNQAAVCWLSRKDRYPGTLEAR